MTVFDEKHTDVFEKHVGVFVYSLRYLKHIWCIWTKFDEFENIWCNCKTV